MRLSQLSITQKMMLAPLLGLLIFSVYLSYSYAAHQKSQEALQEIQSYHFPLLQMAQQSLPLFEHLHNTLHDAVQAGELSWLEKSAAYYIELIELLQILKTDFAPYVYELQITRIETHLIAYYQAASELSNIMILKENIFSEEVTTLIDEMRIQKEATLRYLNDFKNYHTDIVALTLNQSSQTLGTILVLGIFLGVVAMGLIALLTLFVALPTRKTLNELLQSLTRLTQGEANFSQVLTTSSKDELGAMVEAFNTFLRKLEADYLTLKNAKETLETTQKNLEIAKQKAESATRAKSAFLAAMSHEIRTPLNAILGFVALLKAVPLPKKEARYVEIIGTSGTHLLSMINTVLDYSKIEAHKLSLHETDFDLKALIESLTALLEIQALEKGLSLRLELPSDVDYARHGDGMRIQQILINLLGNAIKFTVQGSVGIRVSAQEDLFRFEVWDTGVGMTPLEMTHLFEPFTQADSSNARAFEGTGLGLAISKELAALMGGTIDVHSTKNEGSTFIVTLPLNKALHAVPVPNSVPLPVAPAAPHHAPTHTKPHALFTPLLEALPSFAPKKIVPILDALLEAPLVAPWDEIALRVQKLVLDYHYKEAYTYLKEQLHVHTPDTTHRG